MKFSLFISDLHLRATGRKTIRLFRDFIQNTAPHAEALYILGDLFEYWAGDDDLETVFHRQISDDLWQLSKSNTRLFLMHGNRDFLMSQGLAAACEATFLPDPFLLDLYGRPTLLTHGDTLCTDDLAYQAFRSQVRQASWQAQFLAQPLAVRKKQIAAIRVESQSAKKSKSASIMDVNLQAVHKLLEKHQYPQIIHGHTHRQAHHLHHFNDHSCDRWVLGDWDTRANALRCSTEGVDWQSLSN